MREEGLGYVLTLSGADSSPRISESLQGCRQWMYYAGRDLHRKLSQPHLKKKAKTPV